METVETCVVGGGVTGLAAAWRLGLAGRETLLLERFERGHRGGSSHGATRIFRFAYPDPAYVRMAQSALPLWRELESESGDELLRITGGLDLGEPAMVEPVAVALEACGARVERLADARHRFPWLGVESPAVYSPDTGVLAASRALAALAARAASHGVEIREGSAARSIEVRDDRVVIEGDHGAVSARSCIVAAGGWIGPLLEPLGIRIPTVITREQVFYLRPSAEVLPFIHYGSIARYGVPPSGDAAGIKVGEHGTGEHTSAEGRSFDMDPEGAARVAAYVTEALPGLDPEPVGFETCLYTTTPDHDFVIDARGPLIVASACSGHGFKFAPLLGEALARMTSGSPPGIPLERFALERFSA